jgi:hypothetical protein
MRPWPARLLVLGAVLFFGGWGLVLISGYGGNSVAGSASVWQVGGIMVYLSVPALLTASAWGLVMRVRAAARPRSR